MTFEKEPFRNYGCHSCMVRGPWDSVRGWGLQMGWQHLGEAEKGAIRSEAGGVPCVDSFEGGLETGCQREGLSSKASRGQQRLSLGSVGIDGSGDLWGSCASACPPGNQPDSVSSLGFVIDEHKYESLSIINRQK